MFRFVFTVPPSAVLRGGFFDVRAGRYPHPRICRKFTREGGAVSARHTRGSDHPLPGTPRPGGWAHRPARRLRQSKAEKCAARPDFFTAKRRSVARPDFTRAKSESPVPGWTFPEQSGEVCRPPDFRRAKSESVPGGGSGRRVGVPARAAKNRPPGEKKPGLFLAPTRMYKEARPPFSQKKPLTFRPGRVMDVRAGRETAQKAQPGRAGEAAAGRKETP